MVGTNAGGPGLHYRLRGEVGGQLRAYPLQPGENRIGSVAGNAVVLSVRGVSRHHALLSVEPAGLTLEDLGSKNGTLVKGVRIQRTQLRPGDDVRLGPVALQLEEVDADDTVMAFSIVDTGPAGLPQGDTTDHHDEPGRLGVDLAERLAACVSASPVPDLASLVELMGRELRAGSVCVLEIQDREPVALASRGAVPDLARHAAFAEFVAGATSAGGAILTASLPGEPPLACALTTGPGPERLGLLVAGELRFGRDDVLALLRLLLGLLKRIKTQELAPPPPARRATDGPLLRFAEGYLPGESLAMRSFHAQLLPIVQSDLPVLLLGETGVGKELLALTLHGSSPRSRGPFIAVNCAAIPSDLLEAEMFGVRRGAATSVAERQGKFQLAQGGTLFLDEIGDMPLELQPKLLRALQEKEVQPVGGVAVPVDIRVVAATNSELHRRMQEGRFRSDLYFRLGGAVLRVPSLRERREDIGGLVYHFASALSRESGRAVRGFTLRALRALTEYGWPGNVRELEHEVRHLVYSCPQGQAIDSTMLSPHILAAGEEARGDPRPGDSLNLDTKVACLESELIRAALARAGGNRTQAAKLLGVSRNGLAIKMQRLGLGE